MTNYRQGDTTQFLCIVICLHQSIIFSFALNINNLDISWWNKQQINHLFIQAWQRTSTNHDKDKRKEGCNFVILFGFRRTRKALTTIIEQLFSILWSLRLIGTMFMIWLYCWSEAILAFNIFSMQFWLTSNCSNNSVFDMIDIEKAFY